MFSSSLTKSGEVYTPEISCMKGTSKKQTNKQTNKNSQKKQNKKNSSVIVRFEILPWLYGPEKFLDWAFKKQAPSSKEKIDGDLEY